MVVYVLAAQVYVYSAMPAFANPISMLAVLKLTVFCQNPHM